MAVPGEEPGILGRTIYGVGGAFVGGLIGLVLMGWEILLGGWLVPAVAAGVGFVVAFLAGPAGVKWLAELLWWTD